MSISIDQNNFATICKCDRCGTIESTSGISGRVPDNWGTGQLWVDVAIATQRQVALCFCVDCFEVICDSLVGSSFFIDKRV